MEIESDATILECIDDGLNVLGSSAKVAIYYYLAQNEKLSHGQIAREPERFVKALEHMFGAGTETIVRIISQRIVAHFELDANEDSFLPDLVDMARVKTSIGQGK
ncbi:MAG: hypothetical protein JRN52_01465 [Nitrososphaerota archaeon]|nr:hypothetical protein [Nitrososphaerota archaeon]